MQNTAAIKLSQLTAGIASTLVDAFREKYFWVIADVSSHSFKAEKGYHNFELVEKAPSSSDVIARISAKAWGNGSRRIEAFEEKTGQKFSANIQVLVLLCVEYHPIFGISANVLDIDSNFTLGALEQQRNATLARLVAQNEFIENIKGEYQTLNNRLKIGPVIQSIALLSSSISAGAEDFRHTLENNSFGYAFRVDDYFVSVQGDKNAGQILEKLVEIYSSGILYDAVVITRGGGAQSDFLIFDNYYLARAAAKFPIPIITGIGHQKNESITDLMVHTQTKTPTKAAEFIVAHNREFDQKLKTFKKDIITGAQLLLSSRKNSLAGLKPQLFHGAKGIITIRKQSLSHTSQALTRNTRKLLASHNRNIVKFSAQINTEARLSVQRHSSKLQRTKEKVRYGNSTLIKSHKTKIEGFKKTLQLMSPDNILKKGYAMLRVDGQIISNAQDINKGTQVDIVLADTTLFTTVKEKIHHDRDSNL